MCAPDRSRTLSSHRRGIRADPWATRCIFIRRRKRSLRLRIFPARYVLSRPFILCSFAGFRVYHRRRSAGVESLRREHRACDVDSEPTGTRTTTTTMYPMACRFFELSSKTRRDVVEGYVAGTKIRGIFSNHIETRCFAIAVALLASLHQNYAIDVAILLPLIPRRVQRASRRVASDGIERRIADRSDGGAAWHSVAGRIARARCSDVGWTEENGQTGVQVAM